MSTVARELTVGVVVPRTGRLAPLGDPVEFAMGLVSERVRRVTNGGRRYCPRFVVRDSGSIPLGAARAAEALVLDDGARMVLTLGGSATLPAVAAACQRLRTPCVSTTLPWQVLHHGLGGDPRWSFHFSWGIDDIARAFAEMWERVAPRATVGCLWNDGLHGDALRRPEWGFLPTGARRGHRMLHEPAYAEAAADFGPQVAAFRDAEVITSAATAPDLAAFVTQARARGLAPRLITCSRWLSYPFGVWRAGLDGVATIVTWTPRHPYRSAVDGMSAAELARAYERATGRQWAQPLGLAHALFEVAVHALSTAADPTDGESLARAVADTRLPTVAGLLDWPGGPAPGVAAVALAGGQWRLGERPELVVVANSHAPDAPLSGDLLPAGSRG